MIEEMVYAESFDEYMERKSHHRSRQKAEHAFFQIQGIRLLRRKHYPLSPLDG